MRRQSPTGTVIEEKEAQMTEQKSNTALSNQAGKPHTSAPLLDIKDLSIKLNSNGKLLVDNFNLALYSGQTTALVGESGSGKSLLAHSLLQLLPESMACEGQIFFNGQDLNKASPSFIQSLRGKKVAMIFQEPMTALNPLHTIEKQVSECILQQDKSIKKTPLRQRVIELLKQVQIVQAEQKLKVYPHQLSGGQRQRVMIAMAIANQPDILIADEPTTALDVSVQREILQLLKQLQLKHQLSILLISHDIHMVKAYSDHLCVMQHGRLVEQGLSETLFKSAQHPYTQSLINEPKLPLLQTFSESDQTILSLTQVNAWYELPRTSPFKANRYHALRDINLKLSTGETLGIIGESGSGKTTLAHVLLKLMPSQGEYQLNGHAVQSLNEKAFRPLRSSLQVVFQDPFSSLSPRMTVFDIVREGLQLHSDKSVKPITLDQQKTKVCKALEDTGLDADILYRYPHEFSGGQRQRIAIARALVLEPQCIILDEPTSALDRNVQQQVLSLLLDLQAKLGLSYIFITHDLRIIQQLSHNVAIMQQGSIVEYGPTAAVFKRAEHAYTRTLIDAIS